MNKDLKESVLPIFRIEIYICMLVTIALFFISNKLLVIAFQLGLLVASLNFLASGWILHKNLLKSKVFLIVITTLIRIVIVLMIAMPFINDVKELLSYIIGFTFHFPVLIGFWVMKLKGCS